MEPVFSLKSTDRLGGGNVVFKSVTQSQDHTIDIYTSDNGSDGTIVSINRAALLSALTLQRQEMAHTMRTDRHT